MTVSVPTTAPWGRRLRRPRVFLASILAAAIVAACEPTGPPPGVATPPPSAPGSGGSAVSAAPSAPAASGLVAGTPVVTMDGPTVNILGLGNGITPVFDLPPGTAQMTVDPCTTTTVIPFVTVFDADDNQLGLVVEPSYTMRNLEGGGYYLSISTNPNCTWAVEIVPG